MDHGFFDLHVLPPNPTQEQKAEPLVIENMTKDATVEFLKRVIAKKARQPNAVREIKLYFLGEEMIDSEQILNLVYLGVNFAEPSFARRNAWILRASRCECSTLPTVKTVIDELNRKMTSRPFRPSLFDDRPSWKRRLQK
jgi:hypothetical protein